MGYLDNTGLAYFWEKIKSNFFPGTKLIPGNSDLNDYTTPGAYYCPGNAMASTLANVPIHLAFSLMVLRTTGTGCRQIFMPYLVEATNENTNRIWTRAFYDYAGAWSDWTHLVDDRFTIDGVHVKKQHTTHYGVCSTAAATAVKTVDIPGFELVTGAYVIVKFTATNSAAVANLKLNVSNTGDKPIKHRNGNFPAANELIANRPFMFVYDGTNWQLAIDIDHDSNNYERVRTYYPIKAKSAISTQHVIVAGEDGLYFMLTSGSPFSIKYPPLYATSAISANAKSTNAYYFCYLDAAVITNEAAETLTLNKALYIKGHLNGTTFTPFATKSLVCTEPTTEDGYQYLKLGVVKAASTSNDVLRAQIEMEHPIYEYVNGSFCLYEPKATDAEIDAIFD